MARLHTLTTSIYLQDTGSNKRPLRVIEKFLFDLERSIKPCRSRATEKGYIFFYPNDNDINFFFQTEIVNRIIANNLTVDLGKESQNLRTVFIPDISDDTFDMDNNLITDELEKRNNIKIIKLDKFKASKSKRLYLKIALDSHKSCSKSISKGHIALFNEYLQSQGIGHRTHRPPMTAPGYGAGTRKPLTPSAHIQGEALSSASYWAGQRHQMFPRTPSTIDKELNGPNQLHNISRSPLQSPYIH